MSNSNETAVEVHNLVKRYGDLAALNSINFSVERGTLFGVIGPDGAGKSSLFRILTTLLLPDEGGATVDGLDVVKDYRQLRKRLGYMPGEFALYTDLSVMENLKFFASIFGVQVKENYDMISDIYDQLEPFADRRAGALSGGMKQKLALSCALIHRPSVLVLDEPTTGVDAVSRREFWASLRRLIKEGITILVSTPYMDEASLCDQVALIQDGDIMEINSPQKIRDDFPKPLWAVRLNANAARRYELIQQLRENPKIEAVHPFGDTVHVTGSESELSEADILNPLHEYGFEAVEAFAVDASVEDRFMNLMSRKEAV